MKYFVYCVLIILLPGCASIVSESPEYPRTGCFRTPISQPAQFGDSRLWSTDIFIMRLPYGHGAVGPTKSIHFDQNEGGGFEPRPVPRIIYTVGNHKSSCSMVISEPQCPQAKRAYASLMAQSLPLNFSQNDRDILAVGSSYTYELMALDGKHNMLQWEGRSPEHPFYSIVATAFDDVAQCGASAETAFSSKVF